jgi:capsular exopolysaccharide synthesis family protein
LQESDAKILSLAKTPTRPSSPIVLLNLAIGLVVGFGAATVTVILVELLAPGISTSSEVEQRLGVSSMGTLPLLSSTVKVSSTTHPETYLIQKPFSAFTEAFRNLNTAIHHGLGNEGGKVVAITSALPDEGKTTTTICLARALALSGASVVVVDCDLRRRALHRVLHRSKVGRIEELSDNKIGLIEVLSGKASLEAALKRDEASGAYFLPLAQGDLTTEDVFGSPAMSRLLETLRTKFSHVLLDTAPILPVADTRKLAPKADGVVLLARWRKTNRNAIAAAIKQLDMSGARLLGVALTQVDVRQQARSGAGHADYALNTYRNYYIQ